MNRSARRALAVAVAVTVLLAMGRIGGVSLPMLLLPLGAAALLALLVFGLQRLFGWLGDRAREGRWRDVEGCFHAFDGVPLRIDDDGRHVWIDGVGLQQALRTHDAADVLAARHSGQWRRDGAGALWLRADSVVARLATMPGRDAPRTIRLRRYLEREVLFPAARRRERGGQGGLRR